MRFSLRIIGRSAVLLPLLAGFSGCSEEPVSEKAIRVVYVPVEQRDVTLYGEFVGRTEASERVEVNARVDGFLEDVAFVEGSAVQSGDMLYRIDARPYQAALDRVQATLASRLAQLQKFERDVARIKPLFEEDAASQLDYDEAVSAVETGGAAVREAEADLKRAELQLEYTEIKAPIAGVIGASDVDVGALIRASDSLPLTTVSKINPIYVTYAMSALDYLHARRRAQSYWETRKAEQEGKALEGRVSITLPDDSIYKHQGVVGFTDPQVNPETGTFAVRAILPNPDKQLLPGQYTRVKMPLEILRSALLVPEESILIEQGGVYVMVALPSDRIERRLIFVGPVVDGKLIVEKGLDPGERIVVHGVNKVFHGALVDPITLEAYEASLEAKQDALLQGQSEQQAESASEAVVEEIQGPASTGPAAGPDEN